MVLIIMSKCNNLLAVIVSEIAIFFGKILIRNGNSQTIINSIQYYFPKTSRKKIRTTEHFTPNL